MAKESAFNGKNSQQPWKTKLNGLPIDSWWEHSDEDESTEVANLAYQELRRIEARETFRRMMQMEFTRYYGDPRMIGFGTVGSRYPAPDLSDDTRSSENVIRETVTTLHNRFVRNKPVPTVITQGGDPKEQYEAKEREQWLQGVFQEDKAYDALALGQFHSMVYHDGFVQVEDNYIKGRPTLKLLCPFNVHVDPLEGMYGRPRTIYVVSSCTKPELAARFPDHEEEIWKAAHYISELFQIDLWDYDARYIVHYLEAWHLPSRPGADDGRHVICLRNDTLLNEEWDCDYFPLVKIPWNPSPFGYFSTGLLEDLIGPQRQLNKTRLAIDTTVKLLSSSWWSLSRGSKVVKTHIDNLIGRILEFTGEPPTLNTPNPVSPALVEREEKLKNQIYQQTGVSQLAAQQMKPAGLNSGKALRVYAESEDARFLAAYQAKETAVVDLAELYSRRAQAMLDSGEDVNLSVRLAKDSQLSKIEWKDADLDSFKVLVLPASSLATTLAGRIEDVQDLEALGLITDTEQKRQLLQIPDLKADSDISLAPRQLILKTLQVDIMKEGNAISPEPYWPMELCAQLGAQVLCYAQLHNYPASTCDILREWNRTALAYLNPPQPPAPILPGGPPPAPTGPQAPIPFQGALPTTTPPGVIAGAPPPAANMPGAGPPA